MKRHALTVLSGLALVAFAGCEPGGDATLVAEAGPYELTVNETVSMLAGVDQLPNQPQVVQALGDLWVDYTLLADAARRDSTLGSLDLEPLVEQEVEQRLIFQLRDMAIEVDTAITEEQLQQAFREQAPGARVRARHILISFPSDSSQAARDSARALAEDLREQIAGGEDFAELAQEYSQDRGSAAQGGDLGFFGRGQMVPPFEEAAFALEAGELSEVVESPYGFHVIRVEEREDPPLDEVRDRFRQQLQQRRSVQAESIYIAQLQEGSEITPVEEAGDMTRRMAEDPGAELSGRAARRPVVEYSGGAVTLGEVREFMQTRQPQFLQQVGQAPDDVLEEQVLLSLAQRELLVNRALDEGLTVAEETQDSIRQDLRQRFVSLGRDLNLVPLEVPSGENPRQVVRARVDTVLTEILAGTRNVVPLGPVSFVLRRQFGGDVLDSGIDQTVARLDEARAGPGPDTTGGSTPAPAPDAPVQGTEPGTAEPGAPGGSESGAGGDGG
jgi:hypothetical protein